MHSDTVKKGITRAPHRALFMAMGYTDEEMQRVRLIEQRKAAYVGEYAAQVQLGFRGVESVPGQFQVYVIDEDGSRYANLRQAAAYAFTPARDVSRFKVVVGTPDAVRAELDAVLPKTFALDNNYPNPFNPSTTLPVAIPRTSLIRLVVYNILGEEIRTLYDGPIEAGRYLFTWDGRSGHGNPVATGIYIVRLTTGAGQSFVHKMALLK